MGQTHHSTADHPPMVMVLTPIVPSSALLALDTQEEVLVATQGHEATASFWPQAPQVHPIAHPAQRHLRRTRRFTPRARRSLRRRHPLLIP